MELNVFLIVMLTIMLIDYHVVNKHNLKRMFFTSFTVMSIGIATLSIVLGTCQNGSNIALLAEVLITILMFSLAIFYIIFLCLEKILFVANIKRFIILLAVVAIMLIIGFFSYVHTFVYNSAYSMFYSEIFTLLVFAFTSTVLTIKLGNDPNVSWNVKLIPVCLIVGLILDILFDDVVFIAAPLAIDIFFIYAYRVSFDLSKDSLTGIYNRRLLEVNENMIINPPGMLLVFVIDIDKFKNFNDIYGHQEGDRVLQSVAKILQKSIRKNDFCIRFGGDEFVLIVKFPPELTDTGEITNVANSIAKKIQNELIKYNQLTTYSQKLSLSIGWEMAPSQNYQEALKVADEKMYAKKNNPN